MALQIFNPAYWRLKFERIHSGVEHPKIEELLLAYAYGCPPKEIHASGMIVTLGPLNALQSAESELDPIEATAINPERDAELRVKPRSGPSDFRPIN